MKKIQVELGARSYTIQVKSGMLAHMPSLLSEKNHGQKWIIISQHNLMELFGFQLMLELKNAEFDIDYFILSEGEGNS